MAVNDVKKVYKEIIDDVCTAVREKLSEEGYDDHTLQELKNLWLTKLETSRALEPILTSTVDQATTREYRHAHSGESSKASSLNNKQSTGMRLNHLHPASTTAATTYSTGYPASAAYNPGLLSMTSANSAPLIRSNFPNRTPTQTNIGNNIMKTSNQLDGTNEEIISINSTKKTKCQKKKSKYVEISFQLDGTGPPTGDDDDEDDDSELEGNDADELDDEDDEEGNEEGKEDPNPLCSDDDVSDDEPAQLFETDNVVVCQYDKISRIKSKWRFVLKSGVMNIEGHDYVFSKATGDAEW